jgi:hypothetical protein
VSSACTHGEHSVRLLRTLTYDTLEPLGQPAALEAGSEPKESDWEPDCHRK